LQTSPSADPETRASSSRDRILAIGLALLLVLAIVRVQLIGIYGGAVRGGGRLLLACFYDLVYVAVLTAIFLALDAWAGARGKTSRAVARIWIAVATFSVLAALLNREVVPIFGRPFTYQWLYYSDFLQGQDAKNAIRWFLNFELAALWLAALVGFFVAIRIFQAVLGRVARPGRLRAVAALAAYSLAAGAYFFWGGAGWNRAGIENPVVAFASSAIRAPRISSFLEASTPIGPEDFAPSPPPAATRALAAGAPAPRNVILVVLETAPANQFGLFGGPRPVTPELTRAAERAAIFDKIYAHCPATESSMVSLLLSLYPWLSYRSVTREHPALPFPSLSSELAGRGYRTAFFNSADLRYAGTGNFLAHRHFERVRGYRDIRCTGPELLDHNKPWERYLDGVDDACTMDTLLEWIREPSERPFFGMYWTMMTHLPYFPPEAGAVFDADSEIRNRYLNALRHDDETVGRLLRTLDVTGLASSTLVVVVGDHGESFGTHGHQSHGSKIYEEDVHVPLLFIQPGRFHGERHAAVGGLIDVAPTILDLLDLAPPPVWQGRSLFRADRTVRTYFFAPHSNYYLGFREGDLYYIDNVWQNRFEIYDMEKDPQQLHDLADRMPDRARTAEERLTAWVQYQDRLYRSLFAAPRQPDAVAQAHAPAESPGSQP